MKNEDQPEEIERRAIEKGEARAKFEQLKEEHAEILKFVRDYRTVLDKIYADKMTERIVRGAVTIVLIAVVSALVALVVVK